MCIFCGDMSDPFHGLGPAPLMVGTVMAGRAWRQMVRPALVRAGKLKPTRRAEADEAEDATEPTPAQAPLPTRA